jgi:adenine/guanine phosphoribosyltransferase-like PRPP-binding protein
MRIRLGTLRQILHEVLVGANLYRVTLSDFYAVARQQGGKTYLKNETGPGVFAPYFVRNTFDEKRSRNLASVMDRFGGQPLDIMSAIKRGSVTLDSGLRIVADADVQQQVLEIISQGIAQGMKGAGIDAVVCADSRSEMAQQLARNVAGLLGVSFIEGAFKKSRNPMTLAINDEKFQQYVDKNIDEPEKIEKFRKILNKKLEDLKKKSEKSQYFSIADNVAPQHRRYFVGYHTPESEEMLNSKKILIVDDNIDSGSTMRDLAAIAKSLGIQPVLVAGFKINRQ